MSTIRTTTIYLYRFNWYNAQDGAVQTEHCDGVPEPVGDTYFNPPKWNEQKGEYEFYVNDEYPFDYIEPNGLGDYYFYSDDHTTYCNRGPLEGVGFCYITTMQPNVAYIQEPAGYVVNKDTIVEMHPTVNQIFDLYKQGVELMIENKDGVMLVYALGNKPDKDMKIRISMIDG